MAYGGRQRQIFLSEDFDSLRQVCGRAIKCCFFSQIAAELQLYYIDGGASVTAVGLRSETAGIIFLASLFVELGKDLIPLGVQLTEYALRTDERRAAGAPF